MVRTERQVISQFNTPSSLESCGVFERPANYDCRFSTPMPGWVSRLAFVSKANAPGQQIEMYGAAWEANGVMQEPPARSKRSRAGSSCLKAKKYKRMIMIPSKKTLMVFVAGLALV